MSSTLVAASVLFSLHMMLSGHSTTIIVVAPVKQKKIDLKRGMVRCNKNTTKGCCGLKKFRSHCFRKRKMLHTTCKFSYNIMSSMPASYPEKFKMEFVF